MDAHLPLGGLRVVALEQAVAAPFATRQLADLGAEVVKIERPDGGDPARAYDASARGTSAYFAWLNRGKQSVVLDLKSDLDRAACVALAERADVFVHNLAPGAVERLGLGADALRARAPGLVWCGISGYGPDGPYRDKKAYDLLVQAESGVMSLTGTDATPSKVGVSVADIAAGLYAYSSILAALLARRENGLGRRIDISMLECLTEWMMPPLYAWQESGRSPERAGARHNIIVPYGAYACADGEVLFAIQNDREWRRFCDQVLGDAALADDPRYRSNASRLTHRVPLELRIEERLGRMSRAEALARLEEAQIATGQLNDVAAVAVHPQLLAPRAVAERALGGRRNPRAAATTQHRGVRAPHGRRARFGRAHGVGARVTSTRRATMTDEARRAARSMLFVPATRWDVIVKAAASTADAVCIDLEDSVPPEQKEACRANVRRALAELEFGGKTRIYRINGVETSFAYRDLIEIVEEVGDRVDEIMVPKVGGAEHVQFVARLLTQIEDRRGQTRRIGLQAQIETASGFVWMREIATASPRLTTLIFGAGDYSASLHMPTSGIGTMDANDAAYPGHRYHAVMHAIVAVARAHRLLCLDGPLAAVTDAAGLERSCRISRALGFDGKQCIHPSQLATVHAIFGGSVEEVAHARRVVEAFEQAAAEGKGAVMLDGTMIDEASVRIARVTLEAGRAEETR